MFIVDPHQTTRFLAELVAIDSVNPDLVLGAAGEGEAARWLARTCCTLGLEVQTRDAAPGRPNVLARWPGAGARPSLLLTGHTDTVSLEGMSGPPLEPRVVDGRLYGRGALDMKGGLAAILGAVAALKAAGFAPQGDLWLGFVADEEYASVGTEALVRDIQPAAAVLTEPTDLALCVAHKGFVWLQLDAQGRAAHGSQFGAGVDAIAHAGKLLSAMEAMNRAPTQTHPLLSRPSVHASAIQGGLGWSTYPDRCRLQLEHRTHPNQTAEAVLHDWQQAIDALRAADPDFSVNIKQVFQRSGYEIAREAPVVRALHAAFVHALGREPIYAGTSGWLDSALLGAAGVPTVIFGPGGQGAHAAVEYVELDSVTACARVLAALATAWLGYNSIEVSHPSHTPLTSPELG